MHKQNKTGFKGVRVATFTGKKRTTLASPQFAFFNKVNMTVRRSIREGVARRLETKWLIHKKVLPPQEEEPQKDAD